MALLQLNLTPEKKELRWFAALWFPAFWALAGYLTYRRQHHAVAIAIWVLAAVQSLAGVVSSAAILPAYRLMMLLSYPMGWAVSNIVLVVAYYLVITPLGLIIRIFHDPMKRKLDRGAASYWTPWESSDRYFRQM